MKAIFTSTLFFIFSITTFAQELSGVVKTDDGHLLNAATISLLRSKDSVVVKYANTNKEGIYKLINYTSGDFLVKVSYVGYKSFISRVFTMNGTDLAFGETILIKQSEGLENVTVVARKQVVEVKADRTILNVEGTINSVGNDGLELLRKSPGIVIDKDDNIMFSGKNGVRVYIDGRATPLAGKELSDYLKTIQSSSVESIELISNPSAKYEAAGNAGIINIRLKKNKSLGTNGSVNAGYAIATYPKYNGGLSLNNRNKRTNIFGNVSFAQIKNVNEFNMHRITKDTSFEQKAQMTLRVPNFNYKAGVDYFINPKNTFGIMVNGSVAHSKFNNDGVTAIIGNGNGKVVRYLVSDNSSAMDRDNLNANLNYRFADAKKGQELNMDLDYGKYNSNTDQLQPNYYYDPTRTVKTGEVIYNMLSPSKIHIYSAKADYEKTVKKNKFGAGLKSSKVNTVNDFSRFNVYGTTKVKDTLRSNLFDYDEIINAAYLNYNRSFEKVSLQAGLRAEHTTAKGSSYGFKYVNNNYANFDSSFSRKYIDFFPSVALTFTKIKNNQLSFTYSRRIDRPAYQDLNPFEMKMDEYTFMKGNIGLQPQYTNSFGITNVYKYKLTTTLNFSHVNNIFAQVIDTAEGVKSIMSKKNLATQDIISLNVSYPFMYKKYSAFINLNSFYARYKANFGAGRTVDLDVVAATIFAQQSYKINKLFTAEMNGFYSSPSIFQGTFKSKAMGGIDLGLSANVLKGKGTLKSTVTDVFHTMKWGGTSNFAGQFVHAFGGWESRQFKLNFTYRFGSAEVKAARQRKASLDEESKRTQGSGGIGQ